MRIWWTLGLFLAGTAQAAEPGEGVPSYSYRDTVLGLRLPTHSTDTVAVEWRSVDANGDPVGAGKSKGLTLNPGDNPLEIPVGTAPGHRISYKLFGQLHQLWTNRGTWYAQPDGLKIEQTVLAASTSGQAEQADIVLAGGTRAEVEADDGHLHLEVGRTFGVETGAGVKPGAGWALVLVARGNVGAVMLTIAQRKTPARMEYLDYGLVLEPELRRLVIPLSAFQPRSNAMAKISSLHSLSIRAVAPSNKGSYIEVDHLALLEKPTVLEKILRGADGVRLSVSNASKVVGPELSVEDDAQQVHPLKLDPQGNFHMEDPKARRYNTKKTK